MNTTWIWVVAGVIVLGGLGWWAYTQRAEVAPMQQTTQEQGVAPSTDNGPATGTPASGGTTGVEVSLYSRTQVAAHNSAQSCWTIIDNSVYDLTAWISQHPGGQQAILSICGKDGTAAFRAQHDNAQKQAQILATFRLGALSQ